MKNLTLLSIVFFSAIIFRGTVNAQNENSAWDLKYDITASVNNFVSENQKGSIDLKVEGGVAPFIYVWSNGATTEDLNNVEAGDYVVTVTDITGRSVCFLYTVNNQSLSNNQFQVSSIKNN